MIPISIVMPVFNASKYIEASLNSICMQSYNNFELVIVDDGSSDDSIEKAERILHNSTIVYKFVRQKNQGLSAARNAGIYEAVGEWIICIDSDDCIHPQTFELISQYLSSKENKVICFNFTKVASFPTKFSYIRKEIPIKKINKYELAKKFLSRKLKIAVPTLLIRREIFRDNNIRYNDTCRFSEDQLFIWQLISTVDYIYYTPVKMYFYLLRPNSIMNSSTIEQILTGYNAFLELNNNLILNNNTTSIESALILPRWIIGALHTSSKYLNFSEFTRLTKEMQSTLYIKKLYHFRDIKISLLARLFYMDIYLFYFISRLI